MRERINRLAKGILDPEPLRLTVSPESFGEAVRAGEITRKILTVSDEEGRYVKGLVYSSNSRVRIPNNAFGGVRSRITVEIDGTYLTQEDKIEGAFFLVTNGGERKVPYAFTVETGASGKTLGSLRTAEDFAGIARRDEETALRLFEYQDFVEAPFMQDIHIRTLYDGLKGRANRPNLLEEFLVALKAKEPVRLQLVKKDLTYEKVEGSQGDYLEVKKSTWGYVQFRVAADGEFLELPRKSFTSQDFKDGVCQVPFVINSGKLHGGRNLGALTLSTVRESMTVSVEAQGVDEELSPPPGVHAYAGGLRRYMDLRLEYELDLFEDRLLIGQMRQELESIRRKNGPTMGSTILLAELLILSDEKKEAGELLDGIRGEVAEQRLARPEWYCFYQYLLQLLQRREGQRETLIRLVKKYLLEEGGHPYLFLLWLRLEPSIRENPAELLGIMGQLFEQGCHSPFLYAQAFRIYSRDPLLMHRLGDFELQVLIFAVKRDVLERELALRAAELSGSVKGYHRLHFRLLSALYERYPEKPFLEAVCGLLIKGDCRGREYFPWYQKALEEQVNLTRLYEYFLYALPEDYPRLIPREVLLYFSYEKSLDDASRSLLYTNILKFLKPETELYKQYIRDIEKFTMEQLLAARVNGRLVVLYQHMIYKDMIDRKVARVLPSILRSYQVRLKNPNIRYVVVCYEELEREDAFTVKDGIAYVPLFLERSVLLFQDEYGNRYADIPYEKLPAMEKKDTQELEERCYEVYPNHEMLRLQECGEIVDGGISGEADVATLERISTDLRLRPLYQRRILSRMIQYYQGRPDEEEKGGDVSEYLLGLDMERLTREERAGVCETLIQQDYVREACERLRKYGLEGVRSNRLLKLCTRMILQQLFDEDELLLQLACRLFSEGKYDSVVLDYLCEHFNGSGKQMYRILNQGIREHVEVYDMPERLLAQMLFTGDTERMDQVFDWYAAGKRNGDNLVKAYFTMKSAEYFLQGKTVGDRVFSYLESVVQGAAHLDKTPTIYLVALARHLSTLPELTDGQRKLAAAIVEQLLSENRVFSWFRELGKWVPMPPSVMEKVIVEYQGSRDILPELQVRVLPEEEEFHWEQMRPVYPGIYVGQKVLFEGELLEYRIFEKRGEETVLVKEGSVSPELTGAALAGSRFAALNEMGLCLSLKEEGPLKEKMKKYVTDSAAMEELFQLM